MRRCRQVRGCSDLRLLERVLRVCHVRILLSTPPMRGAGSGGGTALALRGTREDAVIQ